MHDDYRHDVKDKNNYLLNFRARHCTPARTTCMTTPNPNDYLPAPDSLELAELMAEIYLDLLREEREARGRAGAWTGLENYYPSGGR